MVFNLGRSPDPLIPVRYRHSRAAVLRASRCRATSRKATAAATPEHLRGAMYDAVDHGWLEPRRLRRLSASTPLPRAADGRIVLAFDVGNRPRSRQQVDEAQRFLSVR
ncbi:hypothetical protein [Streptomyces adustus]|uniref:hypothetical protein n=1 Tax=Streptomyces adustus TaxID=1609272 RepID=UPI00192E4E9C|nr:hypothetical protein [Streptomyces adustus]